MFAFAKAKSSFAAALAMLALGACSETPGSSQGSGGNTLVVSDSLPENQATAIFAMGCFWCAEADFEKVDGVVDVISGYSGGTTENPTYEDVTYKETGHYEAVLVTYDTTKLKYDDLLKVFWRNVDPFDPRGQFCDKGTSYRAAIFPADEAETDAAEASKERWEKHFEKPIATAIIDRADFYRAEEYHQDYYTKNPIRYGFYRNNCGRDARLREVWGGIAK